MDKPEQNTETPVDAVETGDATLAVDMDEFGRPIESAPPNSADLEAAAREASSSTDYADPFDDGTDPSPVTEVEVSDPSGSTNTITPSQPAVDTPAEEVVEWPEHLLREAGVSAEDAAAYYQTPDRLAAEVRAHDQRMINAAQQNRQQWSPTPDQLQVQSPQSPAQESTPDEVADLLPELDGEEWDPDTVKLVRRIQEAHQKSLQSELSKRDKALAENQRLLQEFQQSQKQQALDRYVDEFDNFIDSLDDEWAGVFGRGSGRKLPKNSMAFQNRLQLDTAANALADGRDRAGLPKLPIDEIRVRALRATFPAQTAAAVQTETIKKVDERRRVMTRRPTQGSAPPRQTGEAAAIDTVKKFFQERGMPSTDFDDDFDISDGI